MSAIPPKSPIDFIERLKPFFFSRDGDITLKSGRSIIVNGGTVDGADISALKNASFVTVNAESSLGGERRLVDTNHIEWTDGGANSSMAAQVKVANLFPGGSDGQVLTYDSSDPRNANWQNVSSLVGGVPSGAVLFWPSTSGAIPTGWSVFSAAAGRVLVGEDGGTFTPSGATGGAETIDIQHDHNSGTLATDSDNHNHSSGTLATDSDNHNHSSGTLATDSDNHNHSSGTLATDTDTHNHSVSGSTASDSHSHGNGSLAAASVSPPATVDVAGTGAEAAFADVSHSHSVSGSTASDSHSHGSGTLAIDNDGHSHNVNSGSTGSDSHSHAVDSGSTGSDSHSHAVDSGSTGNALSSSQSILPPYLVGVWIEKD